MNYLAHAFLSNNNAGLLIGNFIADYVAGNKLNGYPDEIAKGIILHRNIDSFTDAHPKFKESRSMFSEPFRRYSGIVSDILIDHYLASNFHVYSSTPLSGFASNAYLVYMENKHLMPPGSVHFLNYVLEHNVYLAYASAEGIKKVLYHFSKRMGHGVMLDECVNIYLDKQEQFNRCYEAILGDAESLFVSPKS